MVSGGGPFAMVLRAGQWRVVKSSTQGCNRTTAQVRGMSNCLGHPMMRMGELTRGWTYRQQAERHGAYKLESRNSPRSHGDGTICLGV